MNILFICSKNKWRSLTAETIYGNSQEHVVRSAGTSPSARVKVNQNMVAWADIVFCMEDKHKEILMKKFPVATRSLQIEVLDIPDEFKYMDEELIEDIEMAVGEYL